MAWFRILVRASYVIASLDAIVVVWWLNTTWELVAMVTNRGWSIICPKLITVGTRVDIIEWL